MKTPILEKHCGSMVWINPDTEAMRRSECLCLNCCKMTDCKTAHELYEICVRDDIAFMMTRCKAYEPK